MGECRDKVIAGWAYGGEVRFFVLFKRVKSVVQGFVFPPDTGIDLFSDTEDNVFLMEMARLRSPFTF